MSECDLDLELVDAVIQHGALVVQLVDEVEEGKALPFVFNKGLANLSQVVLSGHLHNQPVHGLVGLQALAPHSLPLYLLQFWGN